jgi:hypothetical protein
MGTKALGCNVGRVCSMGLGLLVGVEQVFIYFILFFERTLCAWSDFTCEFEKK